MNKIIEKLSSYLVRVNKAESGVLVSVGAQQLLETGEKRDPKRRRRPRCSWGETVLLLPCTPFFLPSFLNISLFNFDFLPHFFFRVLHPFFFLPSPPHFPSLSPISPVWFPLSPPYSPYFSSFLPFSHYFFPSLPFFSSISPSGPFFPYFPFWPIFPLVLNQKESDLLPRVGLIWGGREEGFPSRSH